MDVPAESLASRMARLQLSQVGVNNPNAQRQPAPAPATAPKARPPPPPPPAHPPRPRNPPRGRTVTLPVKEPLENAVDEPHHDEPDEAPTPVTGITFKSKPSLPPRLPPRRPSVNNSEYEHDTGRLPPPPLPSNRSTRSKSPSGSSTFSINSYETADTTITDESTGPKLPPRLPARGNPPPLPTKRPNPSSKASWQEKSKEGPRGLPPVNDTLPEVKPWKQPEREASLPKKSTFTGNLKKKVGLGSNEPVRPLLPTRKSSGAASSGSSTSTVMPPPVPAMPPRPNGRAVVPPPIPATSPVSNGKAIVPPPIPSSVVNGVAREAKKLPPPSPPPRSILQMGFGGSKGRLPSPERPQTEPPHHNPSQPPPIPLASRPKINLATKPNACRSNSESPPAMPARPSVAFPGFCGTPSAPCLKCRDFSAPDHHASLFPRQNNRDVRQLAIDLTTPFPNITDKARAMFTWMHYNIAYDTVSFFANNVKPSTPASTLHSGLAVCEGYAGLFAAMAIHVGIEAIVVSGHGKGYGYSPVTNGQVPKFNAGHAWNAVRLDHGWHLIDACWGSGNLSGNVYEAKFKAEYFMQTPEQFRRKHCPSNPEYQFCDDVLSWEDYILMDDGPLIYGTFTEPDVDFSPYTLEPAQKVLQPHTRYWFRLTRSCQHKRGSDWVILLNIDGNKTVMKDDGRGGLVAEGTTPAAGKTVELVNITSFDNSPGKGLTNQEYEAKAGRVGMAWSGLCKWTVG